MAKVRARTNAKYRRTNTIIIAIITILTCFSLVMVVYNLIKGGYLFSIAWLIAAILAATYVIIRANTVYATYITLERGTLCMKNWSNDFLPYDYDNKIKILSEFIPAKTKLVEIPVNEISGILIGTKNFIKRNTDPEMEFTQSIRELERTKDFYRKRTVSSMDIFYIETYDKECYYMPIVKFNSRDVIKIVQLMQRENANMYVKASGKEYRSLRVAK